MCQLSYPKAKTIYKSSLPKESSRNMRYIVKACIINFLATHKIIEGKDNNNKLYPNKQKNDWFRLTFWLMAKMQRFTIKRYGNKDREARVELQSGNSASSPPLYSQSERPSFPSPATSPQTDHYQLLLSSLGSYFSFLTLLQNAQQTAPTSLSSQLFTNIQNCSFS